MVPVSILVVEFWTFPWFAPRAETPERLPCQMKG